VRRHLLAAAAGLWLGVAILSGQAPPAQPLDHTARLSGTVVIAGTNRPISGANVVAARIGGPLGEYRTTVTDGKGLFAFRDLAAGTYRVFAQHENYLSAEYGRRVIREPGPFDTTGPTGTPVTLADRQSAGPITIGMTPPGVIAGRVLDADGRPLRSVIVDALKARYLDGDRTLSSATWTQTDDRGEYRLFGLVPGSYYVSARAPAKPRISGVNVETPRVPSIANGNSSLLQVPLSPEALTAGALDPFIYPVVYHPGTGDMSAAIALDVTAGATTTAATLSMMPAPAYRVRGRLTGMPANGRAVRISTSGASVETRDGTFELSGLPPGRYVISGQAYESAPWLGGTTTVDVIGANVDDVSLSLQSSVAVSGSVTIDGRAPTPADGILTVQILAPFNLIGLGAQRVQPDGMFTFATVFPRQYTFRVTQAGKRPWVKSATFGSEDATNTPFTVQRDNFNRRLEIALSTRTGTIAVQVLDEDRKPAAGTLVVAVPDAVRRNRSSNFLTATTDTQGRARLDSVAPGEYRLLASGDIDVNDWQNPEILRKYESRGELVRLAEAGSANVTVRVLP
jgi:protocatechuate 3,4-dioxygenase beta subunit